MKENIKILNITFDTKVKIVMSICIVIAIIIIAYSFYYICISRNLVTKNDSVLDISDIMNTICYEAEYDITVNGNKTSNKYNVKENVDFENQIYNMKINDNLDITITSVDTRIVKNQMENEYVVNNEEILRNNVMSFSSVIDCYNKVLNKQVNGSITRIEQDDEYIYSIQTDECYIEKVNKIEIYTLKENCKIIEIKMYNTEEKELYSILLKSFIVKK